MRIYDFFTQLLNILSYVIRPTDYNNLLDSSIYFFGLMREVQVILWNCPSIVVYYFRISFSYVMTEFKLDFGDQTYSHLLDINLV